jgi:leader peptidase (prepilin peptidase) / N-methyltransferase
MVLVLIGFIVGSCLGSLVKALADRSLISETYGGRSYCTYCKHQLAWYDLIPLVSFLTLKGRCRYCHRSIGNEYILVELLMGLLGVIAFLQVPGDYISTIISGEYGVWGSKVVLPLLNLLFELFAISVFVILLLTDIKSYFIPNRITFPSLGIALSYLAIYCSYTILLQYIAIKQSAIGLYLMPPYSDYFYQHVIDLLYPLQSGLLAAMLIGLFFGTLILITKGRGMGGGDLKLGVFIGLVLGISNALLAILLAFLLGSIVGVALLILRRKKMGEMIPFGPFLSAGAIIALFWGEHIINWYFAMQLPS